MAKLPLSSLRPGFCSYLRSLHSVYINSSYIYNFYCQRDDQTCSRAGRKPTSVHICHEKTLLFPSASLRIACFLPSLSCSWPGLGEAHWQVYLEMEREKAFPRQYICDRGEIEEGTAMRRLYCHSFSFHCIYSCVLAGLLGQLTTLVTGTPGIIGVIRHWNREVVDAPSLEVLTSGWTMLWTTWSGESWGTFQPKSFCAPVFLWFLKDSQNPVYPFCADSVCCSHPCPYQITSALAASFTWSTIHPQIFPPWRTSACRRAWKVRI